MKTKKTNRGLSSVNVLAHRVASKLDPVVKIQISPTGPECVMIEFPSGDVAYVRQMFNGYLVEEDHEGSTGIFESRFKHFPDGFYFGDFERMTGYLSCLS